MQVKQEQASSLTMRGLGRKRKQRCGVDGHGGGDGQQVFDDGLDVVVIVEENAGNRSFQHSITETAAQVESQSYLSAILDVAEVNSAKH